MPFISFYYHLYRKYHQILLTVSPVNDLKSSGFLDNLSYESKGENEVNEEP